MNSFLGTDFRTGIIIWINVSLIINIGLFVSGMLLVDKDILLTTRPTDMFELPLLLKITFIWVFFCILNDVILSGALYCDVGTYYANIWKFFASGLYNLVTFGLAAFVTLLKLCLLSR